MRHYWVDQFIYQTRIAMHIVHRDTSKRLATAGMMTGILYWAGNERMGIVIGSTIAVFECVVWALINLMQGQNKETARPLACIFWLLNCVSMLPYLSFSLVLATDSSMAFVIAGYLWLFGVYVHTSNSFSFLPIYNWSLMIPAFFAAFLLFYFSANHPIEVGNAWEWVIAGTIMFIYILNTIETMAKHNDTQAALARARSEAVARLKELEFLARHDKLTGLKNRVAFDEELAQLLDVPSKISGLAVFIIDLDDFKPINDSYSHLAGDAVLIAVANSLLRIAGPNAIVARLGGDEFAAVIPDISSDDAAVRLGSYIVRALNAPIRFQGKQLRVGASLGIALASKKLCRANDLCAGADQAMYRAKVEPGQKAVLFDPKAFPARATLEDRNTLFEAIRNHEIKPYYQPKVCVNTLTIVGFEALARWTHPTRGLLRPRDFLQMVTEFGLHGELVMQMARQVLMDVDSIYQSNLDCGQISINVPEVTLASLSGRDELARIIDAYPHLRRHLTFEITEDVFIARSGEMIQRSIAFFRSAGVRVSLDDFGTGFASFQHLRVLEFDELKLDTGFVQGLGKDPTAEVLVGGFLAIGKGLGVQVVAEGVETPAQLAHLRALGCDVAQGYLFGAAMTVTDAIGLLKTGKIHLEVITENAA